MALGACVIEKHFTTKVLTREGRISTPPTTLTERL
nr:N-acetylneuraminate synthase family protein [Leptospira ellisii]